jgi:hypothetical protein
MAARLLRRALPMGAIFSLSIALNKTSLSELLPKLRSHPSEEISALESQLTSAVERGGLVLKPDHASASGQTPKPLNEIISQLSSVKLPQHFSDADSPTLISASPRNEFELLADSLYALSDLTREDILRALDTWSYQQKTSALTEALKASPELLSIPNYKFDATSDRISLLDIMLSEEVKIQAQQPTVRYGYDVPAEIERAQVDDLYLNLFDSFLELFSSLQVADNITLLPYATLAGHKTRWQATLSPSQLKTLADSTRDPLTKTVISGLTERISEAHPLISRYLTKTSATPTKSAKKRPPKKKKR